VWWGRELVGRGRGQWHATVDSQSELHAPAAIERTLSQCHWQAL